MIQPASNTHAPFEAATINIKDRHGDIVCRFLVYEEDGSDAYANARYFAHAANVLPGCVEAMAEAYADIGSVLTDKKMHAALAKLKAALDAARGER